MSIFGDAMTAVRNVILMQSTLERTEAQLAKLDETQDKFREALFSLSERLTRVETHLFDPPIASAQRQVSKEQ